MKKITIIAAATSVLALAPLMVGCGETEDTNTEADDPDVSYEPEDGTGDKKPESEGGGGAEGGGAEGGN